MNINHKNKNIAFFFHALYGALVITIAFIINSSLDKIIDKNRSKKLNPYLKTFIHFITILIIAMIVIYILYYLFGWGNALVPF